MIREVDLLGHLPPFLQSYREIREIMTTEQELVQKMEDETELIKNNQFIITCDTVGIAMFERLLGIVASKEDNLESRISRVLIRWNDVTPYTYKVLLQKLSVLCRGNNFTVLPNFNEYELEILTHLELYGQVDELKRLITEMIPANLVVTSKNELAYITSGSLFIASGITVCDTFIITDSLNANFTIIGKKNYGATLGLVEVVSVDTFEKEVATSQQEGK